MFDNRIYNARRHPRCTQLNRNVNGCDVFGLNTPERFHVVLILAVVMCGFSCNAQFCFNVSGQIAFCGFQRCVCGFWKMSPCSSRVSVSSCFPESLAIHSRSTPPVSFMETTSASLAESTVLISLRGDITCFEKIAAFCAPGSRGATPCF